MSFESLQVPGAVADAVERFVTTRTASAAVGGKAGELSGTVFASARTVPLRERFLTPFTDKRPKHDFTRE